MNQVTEYSAKEYRDMLSKKKQLKYRNKPSGLDGIRFDSIKEKDRYGTLKMLQSRGKIRNLHVHKPFPLIVNDTKVGTYESDFTYESAPKIVITNMETWEEVVEDVKSPVTRKLPVYRLKKKLMLACYGIEIKEV